MRLSDGQVDGKGSGWARALAYSIISILITFSVAGVLFRAGPLSLIWMFILSVICVVSWIKSRAINRSLMFQSFLATRDETSRQKMAVDFIQHNGWQVARRAKRFLKALTTGVDWPKAMEQAGIALSSSEVFSCRCKAKYGPDIDQSIPLALDPLRIQSETERLLARLMTVPWIIFVFPPVVSMFMWFIVPTFKQMFEEFELTLPNSILSLIAMSDFTIQTPLASLLVLALFLLQVVGFCILLLWLFPKLTMLAPFRWFVTPYIRALALTSLAMSVRREPNFASACHTAAELLPIALISDNLKAVAGFYSQGMPPEKAIARTGLLKRREAETLSASVNSHSFPWALEQIAVAATERMLRLYSVAIQLLIVVAVLSAAVLCGWVAVGTIETLSIMILQLT